jgi:protein phosphatase
VCERGIGFAAGGRATNEDNFLVAAQGAIQMRHESRPGPVSDGVLVAVADGMGGIAGGEAASRAAVEAMTQLAPLEQAMSPRRLLQHIRNTHRDIRTTFTQSPTPGTTLTLFRSTGNRAVWANVGDSRIYRLRMGRLEQLSRDQTRNEFHKRDGTRPQPDGDHLAQAFIFGSRGLGFDNMIRLEVSLDAAQVELRAGDMFLMSSDGLHDVLREDTLRTLLANAPSAQDAASALHDAAIAAGSTDNVTAVVLRVEGMLPLTAAPLDDTGADTIQF